MAVHVFMGTTAPRFSILTATSLLSFMINRLVPGLLCGSVMSRLGPIFADRNTSVGAAILFNFTGRSKCLMVHCCLSSEENERTVCLCCLKSLLTVFSDLEANLISSLDWKSFIKGWRDVAASAFLFIVLKLRTFQALPTEQEPWELTKNSNLVEVYEEKKVCYMSLKSTKWL